MTRWRLQMAATAVGDDPYVAEVRITEVVDVPDVGTGPVEIGRPRRQWIDRRGRRAAAPSTARAAKKLGLRRILIVERVWMDPTTGRLTSHEPPPIKGGEPDPARLVQLHDWLLTELRVHVFRPPWNQFPPPSGGMEETTDALGTRLFARFVKAGGVEWSYDVDPLLEREHPPNVLGGHAGWGGADTYRPSHKARGLKRRGSRRL